MKLSVFITSYNQKAYLVQAIESVLAQTRQPDEILIVDDCSGDGSQQLIDSYAQRYPSLIRAFCHDKNLGIPLNKSFALEHVRGDYVTYLDGDDRFLPTKLEEETQVLTNNPRVSIAFSNVYYINEQGNQTGLWATNPQEVPSGDVFAQAISRQFPHGSLYRNELIEMHRLREVGFYDPQLPIYEDWDLRIRLTKRFQTGYTGKPLVEYRIHDAGISHSSAELHLEVTRNIFRKHDGLLRDLSRSDRRVIRHKMRQRLADLAQRAAMQQWNLGRTSAARRYWFRSIRWGYKCFDGITACQMLLPQPVYTRLVTAYHRYRPNQKGPRHGSNVAW